MRIQSKSGRLLCVLVASSFGAMSAVDTASARSATKRAEGRSQTTYALKHQRSGVRIPLPLGPAYIYNDYPYYYSRGFYPTHIGGYVYYPAYDEFSRDSCSPAMRTCVVKHRRRSH